MCKVGLLSNNDLEKIWNSKADSVALSRMLPVHHLARSYIFSYIYKAADKKVHNFTHSYRPFYTIVK